MAKRYCGDVSITLEWRDEKNRYRAVVRGTKTTQVVWVGGRGTDAVDSPKAYDAAARAALSFAMEGDTDIADDSALGVADGEYRVTRKPLCTSR